METKGKTVFITGGTGFIASALIGRIVNNNRVIAFDNLLRNSLKYKSYKDHPNLTLIKGDILNRDALEAAMQEANIVVHTAAIAGIYSVGLKPVQTMRVNMVGSAYVLDCASRLPALERCVSFSTGEVFGKYAVRPCESDEMKVGTLGEPRWTYAASKLAEEHLTIAYHNEQGLPTTIVRPFNVYGPHQVGEGALKIFIEKALNNEQIEIHGDGSQIRSWCYIDDMVDGTLLAMTHQKAIGQSFNISNPQSVITILGLAQTVVRVLDSRSEIKFVEKQHADVDVRIPTAEHAAKLLGFKAKVSLEEGIRLTAESYRSQPELLKHTAVS